MWLKTLPWVLSVVAVGANVAVASEEESEVNIFSGDLGTLFWTLLIFILVLVALAKFAWRPILTGLHRREKFIHDALANAKRDREEAESRLKEMVDQLKKARAEASAIVDEGRKDGETVRRRIEEEARRNADAMIERAKREIGVARDSALGELHEQSARMAMQMAGVVLKRQLTPEDHGRLITEALGMLKDQGASGRN